MTSPSVLDDTAVQQTVENIMDEKKEKRRRSFFMDQLHGTVSILK